jgi:hypothetical protein
MCLGIRTREKGLFYQRWAGKVLDDLAVMFARAKKLVEPRFIGAVLTKPKARLCVQYHDILDTFARSSTKKAG